MGNHFIIFEVYYVLTINVTTYNTFEKWQSGQLTPITLRCSLK